MSRSPAFTALFVEEVAVSVEEWRAVAVRLGRDGAKADVLERRPIVAIVEKTFMVLSYCVLLLCFEC